MRRKTFDTLLTTGGLVVAIVLVLAGALLMWGHDFANSNVRSQLAEQEITFPSQAAFANPPAGSTEITPAMKQYLYKYGGEQLLTGPQAKAYADHFIAVHLSEMPYNGVFSKVSSAAIAQPNNTALKAEASTVFEGTTLRGLLLEAYAFWEMGQIALIASICSFILAGVMLVLSGVGFWHLRKVDPAEEFLPAPATPAAPVATAKPAFAWSPNRPGPVPGGQPARRAPRVGLPPAHDTPIRPSDFDPEGQGLPGRNASTSPSRNNLPPATGWTGWLYS